MSGFCALSLRGSIRGKRGRRCAALESAKLSARNGCSREVGRGVRRQAFADLKKLAKPFR